MIHVHVDAESGTLLSSVWLRMVWNDGRLQWNESDYNNVSFIHMSPDKIWLPDVLIYNSHTHIGNITITKIYKSPVCCI